ncbi:MAG: NUDIX hydrolase [Chloroflexi bacterium]|nr:NUDIX hydrolase [Chloroflexota bacterium]
MYTEKQGLENVIYLQVKDMGEFRTITRVSAGGVAFRCRNGQIEIVIISVGEKSRWQLPKGLVDDGETLEKTARREVREEAGVLTEPLESIHTIQYWYYATEEGQRVRVHKTVHFFLLQYLSGDPQDHDQEVNEARWVELDKAEGMLAFDSEREVVARAKNLIEKRSE